MDKTTKRILEAISYLIAKQKLEPKQIQQLIKQTINAQP